MLKRGMEPFGPAPSMPGCKGKFVVTANSGIHPASRVAEAFTKVLAPLWADEPIGRFGEHPLAKFGRPAEFPSSMGGEFAANHLFIRCACLIAQPDPGEVKDLMQEDAHKFIRMMAQFAFEHDRALTDEGSGVNGLAARLVGIELLAIGSEGRQETDTQRGALVLGQRAVAAERECAGEPTAAGGVGKALNQRNLQCHHEAGGISRNAKASV
jgi:hypothetical protein